MNTRENVFGTSIEMSIPDGEAANVNTELGVCPSVRCAADTRCEELEGR